VQVCTQPASYDSQGYPFVYSALKSYLITTSHHEKSTPEFLAPALDQHWKKGQQVDPERDDLARQNFAFYSGELLQPNGYIRSTIPDSTAVQNCRDYLNKFGQTDRIYQNMLDAAGGGRKQFVFNREYPGTAETVINNYPVDPAYTKPGFALFQKQLEDSKYFNGEDWVLGPSSKPGLNKASQVPQLRAMYQKNYIKTWQDYLRATRVVGYASVPDAANKLEKIGSSQSLPLALCVASENTGVAAKDIADAFQPVQFVTPAPCLQKPIGPSNKDYMTQLLSLQNALKQVGPIDKADPATVTTANAVAGEAEKTAGALALNFSQESSVRDITAQLLKDPIARATPLLVGAGAGAVNGPAGGMCAAISGTLSKYPFNPRSNVDATLQEVNDFLKPGDGRLWQLYSTTPLNKYLVPAGDGFQVVSGQPLTVTPSFLNFFTRAARMSKALYKGDAQAPNFTFNMQPLPAPDVDHISLTINGTSLSTDLRNASPKTFSWPGSAQGVDLKVSFGRGSLPFGLFPTSGLWAIWRFIDSGERVPGGTGLELQWVQRTSVGESQINGHSAAVKFALDPASAQILRPQYFSGLNCVSRAVAGAR
jgi:type VI secretion system protein ImpL